MAAVSLLLSGCFTPKLYKDSNYREQVSGLVITEDGKKLVVLGTDYRYIFDLPASLRPVQTALLNGSNPRTMYATVPVYSVRL